MHHEIEHKYLIRYPDTELLKSQPGCEVWEIEQIYLTEGENNQTRRVRRVVAGGQTFYYKTFKRRLTALTAEEDESALDEAGWQAYLNERNPLLSPIRKTRLRIPYAGHLLEFDLYPFWNDRAVMEIELDSETEQAAIPDYVDVIRDVSDDRRYKNRQLAVSVPMDDI